MSVIYRERLLDILIARRIMGLNVVDTAWPCQYDIESGAYEACFHNGPGIIAESDYHNIYYDAVYLPTLPNAAVPARWPPVMAEPDDIYPEDVICSDVRPVPAYSTSIALAWSVVEHFHTQLDQASPVVQAFQAGFQTQRLWAYPQQEAAMLICQLALWSIDQLDFNPG